MAEWWEYDQLESKAPYDWYPAGKGDNYYDNIDYHVDLGAGKLPKGRLTIDRHGDADILMDLNTFEKFKFGEVFRPDDWQIYPFWFDHRKLPFPDNSIESIISHHCLEHIGTGYLRLMDECYRVLKPGGIFRIVVPLFPSLASVTDPDHVRYFTPETFNSFVGRENQPFWTDVFAEPYTKCRFELVDQIVTPSKTIDQISKEEEIEQSEVTIDHLFKEPREIRVALKK